MATAKITLSASRDIPFNKLVLSQSNVRRIKAGVSVEELAEDIARHSLLQSLNVRPVLDASGNETDLFEVPAGGRRFRALELLVKQKRMMHDDGTVERRVRLLRPMERPAISVDDLTHTHWREADRTDFVRAWEAEIATLPEFTDSTLHIVTGLLLPIWKRLPSDSMRIYRLQTDAGERIIGRLVSPAWVALAVESEAPTLSPTDAFTSLLDGRTVLQLQDGLGLRRVRTMGEFRIELAGFTDAMVDRLKATGLISEIISWKLRLFVPTGASGLAILTRLMDRHPLVRVADRPAA